MIFPRNRRAGKEQASWFEMNKNVDHDRLFERGLNGHQVAVSVCVDMTDIEKEAIIEAILTQKIGSNPKPLNNFRELRKMQKDVDHIATIKIKISKMNLGIVIKWNI